MVSGLPAVMVNMSPSCVLRVVKHHLGTTDGLQATVPTAVPRWEGVLKMRLIDADALQFEPDPHGGMNGVVFLGRSAGKTIQMVQTALKQMIADAPTIQAVPVVHGYWRKFTHSALVNWKNGEPVWADRAVYRCSECDFGTIAKHNYCPRCGARMGGVEDA
jgi:hypothetical protein